MTKNYKKYILFSFLNPIILILSNFFLQINLIFTKHSAQHCQHVERLEFVTKFIILVANLNCKVST